MRIAIWHNLPSGGGKRALYDQVVALLRLGHAIELWRPPSREEDYLPLSSMVKEHVVPIPTLPSTRTERVRQLLLDTDPTVAAMDSHCAKCAAEITASGFDVLFANACTTLRVTSIARLTPLPSLLYLQEPYRWLYEALPDPPWAADDRPLGWWHNPRELRRAFYRGLSIRRKEIRVREETRNARAFDAVVCNSLYSRESILRSYGLSATVCYLGIDHQHFSPPNSPDAREPFFLTVGAVTPEKNPEFLIRALARRADRTWPLVWVGNFGPDDYVNHLRRLACDCGVDVVFRIAISDDELLALYRQATLLLYAPRLEPFGLAPLEAAACGLPTVAVAEAGTRETVVEGTNGFLVGADEDSFAAKIDELVNSPGELHALGATARGFIEEQWTSVEAGKRLERLLAETANGNR